MASLTGHSVGSRGISFDSGLLPDIARFPNLDWITFLVPFGPGGRCPTVWIIIRVCRPCRLIPCRRRGCFGLGPFSTMTSVTAGRLPAARERAVPLILVLRLRWGRITLAWLDLGPREAILPVADTSRAILLALICYLEFAALGFAAWCNRCQCGCEQCHTILCEHLRTGQVTTRNRLQSLEVA